MTDRIASYAEWCALNNCQHGECPNGHEHPQPFMCEGEPFCGECYNRYGEAQPLVPCTPEVC